MPTNPDPYIDPKAPISPLSIASALGWSPRIVAHVMLWFGNPGHLDVGYHSSDPATVARQVSLLRQWGVDVAMLDWYGTLADPQHAAALAWKAECEKQGLHFAVCMDRGIFQPWNIPKTADVTTWATQMMQFAHANFISSPMYEKTTDGRALMINFDWAGVTGLDAAKVMAPYGDVAMLWEHSGGVSKPHSAGAFAWIGVSATDSQNALEAYATNFLAACAKSHAANPALWFMGSLCDGFDDHNRKGGDPTKSCWDATMPARFADWKQGQTFENLIAIYNASAFKPQYMQLVTFNDFEEDTVLERGIDSLATVSAVVSHGVVTLTLTGNLNTIDHVDLTVNGAVAMSVPPRASITFDLNTLKPIDRQQFACQAVAVGRPLFQNKISLPATTMAVLLAAQTVQVPVKTTVEVPVTAEVPVTIDTTVDVPIAETVQGLTVSGTVTVPVKKDVTLSESAVAEVPVEETITVALPAQIAWSL